MKQKFTIEKNKYLENKNLKNETMFNFKISCLMKKQVINLMMTLAIVFGLSVSAMAQNDADENNSTTRYIMVTGSTHTFSATLTSGNTYSWGVYVDNGDGTGTNADLTDITTSQSASGTVSDVDTEDDFLVTWAESAGGNYFVELTETRAPASIGADCAVTTRRFFIQIIDFDLFVYVTEENTFNQLITADELAECGVGTVANYGDVLNGDPAVGQAFSNTFNTTDSETGLPSFEGIIGTNSTAGGTTIPTTRYIALEIHWGEDLEIDDIPILGSVEFDFDIDVTSGSIDNIRAVNGDELTSTDGTGSTYVDGPGAVDASNQRIYRYKFPVQWNDLWGTDIIYDLDVTNFTLYPVAGGAVGAAEASRYALGVEPTGRETDGTTSGRLTNLSEDQTILAAPATTPIGVGQN